MKTKYLNIPFKSFGNFDFYREVAFDWKGTNLFYLLVLVAICWIPIALRLQIAFSDMAEKYSADLIRQIPEISFNDGMAKSSIQDTVFIKMPDSGELIGIIDTSNRKFFEGSNQNPAFVLRKDSIILQNSNGASQTWQIGELGLEGLTINQGLLEDWVTFSKKYFVAFLFPFAVFITFAFRMLQIFIYSGMILLLSGISKAGLKFENAFRLSTVAITPGLIFKACIEAAGLSFRFDEAIMSIITLGLAATAIKRIKSEHGELNE